MAGAAAAAMRVAAATVIRRRAAVVGGVAGAFAGGLAGMERTPRLVETARPGTDVTRIRLRTVLWTLGARPGGGDRGRVNG
ncbi:hypothetical protein GCM10010343_04530 [Streptomyces avidinii]|nr:hypothetical protein GCM10010343_04530 [Streptomyces avidinii]